MLTQERSKRSFATSPNFCNFQYDPIGLAAFAAALALFSATVIQMACDCLGHHRRRAASG